MKKFREYLSEEMQPFAHTEKGFVGVDNNAVRDNINLILANVTSSSYATPYHAIEMIRKALAPFHISLPATLFLDGEYGHEVFEINQFGEKSGVTDSGEVITLESSPYFIYFEYDMNDKGSFEIFSEIVNADELNEIMSEVDDELEDEEELDEEVAKPTGDLKDACWKGYTAVGMKMKNGKRVPNCVPVKEAMSPGRAGEIAAGRKGSTPAEQGSIAVRKDDESRAKTPQKANFNVAKNLARKAMKAQVAKAKEKK